MGKPVKDVLAQNVEVNTSEPSNASTSVVNAPREPYVVKQDNGNVLRDGEACKRCTCPKCGSGLSKGLCYICRHNQNSLNDSPRISETSSQSPPNINPCCYKCGDPLDGIFCKRCTCKSYGKNAHIGYNCPSKVSVISIPKPCNNQTIDELPQALPNFHPTFHSEAESPFTLDSTPTYVDESPNVFNPPPQPPVYPCEFCGNDAYFGHYCTPQASFIYPEPCYNQDFNFPQNFQNVPQQYPCCDDCGNLEEKQLEEEQAAKAQSWKFPVCYDDDDDEEGYNSLNDNIISELPPYSAVIPTEPIDYLSMEDEHLDTILATKSDEFIKSSVKNLVPNPSESEDENECDVPTGFTTFSNVLFDDDYDSDSSDDQSLSVEDPEKEIRLTKRLLYDNSSPRPPEEIVSDISNADIESFSPSPIPNEDSDSHMEEIDLYFNPDDSMPRGIEDDDDDSERDIPILEELLDNYSLS
nr:hypothetical protein [Tanacetum cinerariifolium]